MEVAIDKYMLGNARRGWWKNLSYTSWDISILAVFLSDLETNVMAFACVIIFSYLITCQHFVQWPVNFWETRSVLWIVWPAVWHQWISLQNNQNSCLLWVVINISKFQWRIVLNTFCNDFTFRGLLCQILVRQDEWDRQYSSVLADS